MNAREAQEWLVSHAGVSRETLGKLSLLLELVLEENTRQNLISSGTVEDAWARHIVDSAQLLLHAPAAARTWIDFGTGAGFPGLVAGLLFSGEVALVEERKRRAEFLQRAVDELAIGRHTTVHETKLERLNARQFDVISARAFAPLPRLLELGYHFSTSKTRWILPKGRNAASELEAISPSWQGNFRIEKSVTDDDAGIIVADRVQPNGRGRAPR